MQDFFNALFIFFLTRNNKLTINLSQTFFYNVFIDIEDIANFFPIHVYPAVFFVFLLAVFVCHEKIDFLVLVERTHISIFEFLVAIGSITWNGSETLRNERKGFGDKGGFPTFRNNFSSLLGCKVVEKIDNPFCLGRFQYESFKGPSIKYVRSNLVIFRHPLPSCTLLNNRMTS